MLLQQHGPVAAVVQDGIKPGGNLRSHKPTKCNSTHQVLVWGELLPVDTFAHNKSSIAYQDESQRPESVVASNHQFWLRSW
jgi:hypothetical protein